MADRPRVFARALSGAVVCVSALGFSWNSAIAQTPPPQPAPANRPAPTAEELAGARTLFKAGVELARQGQCAEALRDYEAVVNVIDTSNLRYYTAECDRKIGRLARALAMYQLAETLATNELKIPEKVQTARVVLGAVKEPIATLSQKVPRIVISVPAGAQNLDVMMDDTPVAAADLNTEMRIDVGPHHIVAGGPTYATFDTTANVTEGARFVVTVRLDPKSAAVATPIAPGTSARNDPAPMEPPPDVPPSHNHTLAIVTTAGAVVMIGAGIGAFMVAGNKDDDAKTTCAARTSGNCDDLRSPVRTFDALALTGFLAGAGLTALSIVLWVQPSAPSHAASLYFAPGSAGVRGSF